MAFKISVARIELYDHREDSKLKAFVSINLEEDGMKITLPRLHLFFGEKGPFLDPPSYKVKGKDPKKDPKKETWYPYYYLNKKANEKMTALVVEAYKRKSKD